MNEMEFANKLIPGLVNCCMDITSYDLNQMKLTAKLCLIDLKEKKYVNRSRI